jgi:predicted short-subunit dehydrogenase-like oxidoreductase (DUF2520 family)
MDIAILGTGNLAWHLARAIQKNGHEVVNVYARNLKKAENFANMLYEVRFQDHLDFRESTAKIFFLCVSDDAILDLSENILMPQNAVLVHCSGNKSLSELEESTIYNNDSIFHSGVFYPLMTFTKGKELDFSNIPICIEAKEPKIENLLYNLAKDISKKVYSVSSEERKILHTAAVFSCNFVNHLWALSKEILESENLDFEILKPIIFETYTKAMNANHPADAQTGPAIRRDETTLKDQKKYLADDEDLQKVYSALTESIQDWHKS